MGETPKKHQKGAKPDYRTAAARETRRVLRNLDGRESHERRNPKRASAQNAGGAQ